MRSCVRDERGRIIEELRLSTKGLPKYLGKRPSSRVIVETCTEAFCVADAATAAGHDVRVVPATLVRALGVGERGIKTDQRDARKLSEVSTRVELPGVHVPSQQSRDRIAKRRGKQIAAVALARKLAGILFSLYKHAAWDVWRQEQRSKLTTSARMQLTYGPPSCATERE